MSEKAPEYRWAEIKTMLDDIPTENTHYSRVQGLIKSGDDLLKDHNRLVDIIYSWHETHTTMTYAIKELLRGSQSGRYFLPSGGYNINKFRDELKTILRVGDKQ